MPTAVKARLAGVAVLVFVIAGIMGGTATAHQSKGCIPGLVVIGTGQANQPTLYIHQNGGVWLYAETNAHTGLQTGGPTILSGVILEDPGQDDPCFNHDCKPVTTDECPAVKSDQGIL